MDPNDKLYVITRQDLSSAYTVPQAMHAAMEFAAQYPAEHKQWHTNSNYIIVLAKPDERSLWEFSRHLKYLGFQVAEFREPDVAHELTAIAIVPSSKHGGVKKACSGIALSGKYHDPNALAREKYLRETVRRMEDTRNERGQSIMEQNIDFHNHVLDLVEFLRNPEVPAKRYHWRFPRWLMNHTNRIPHNLMDDFDLMKAALLHDPEKEFSISLEEGMAVDPRVLVSGLVLALAELHANTSLYGGGASENFRSRWKKIDRLGNQACELLFSNQ